MACEIRKGAQPVGSSQHRGQFEEEESEALSMLEQSDNKTTSSSLIFEAYVAHVLYIIPTYFASWNLR